MKIAVITLHRVFNYGSILQAYATQKILEEIGHDVEIIDYITEQRTLRRLIFNIPNSKKSLFSKVVYIPLKIFSIIIKKLVFGRFMHKNLNLTKKKYISYTDLQRSIPEADIYITGSDQVWNSEYNEGIDKGFFLEFVPSKYKRIAYSSSFGKEKLDDCEYNETKNFIHKYANISVREDTALEILNELGYSNATCVLDPTLQMEKEEWIKLAKRRVVKEKYLLLMLLYNEDNSGTEYAQIIAKQKGLKIVKLSWEYKKPKGVDILKTHKSPEEFLSLFLYADYIVTNSFHGLAYSINFNKDFIIIPRNEFNTRIESMLRLTNLQSRMLVNGFSQRVIDMKIDYVKINSILEEERKKGVKYLKKATFD